MQSHFKGAVQSHVTRIITDNQ